MRRFILSSFQSLGKLNDDLHTYDMQDRVEYVPKTNTIVCFDLHLVLLNVHK